MFLLLLFLTVFTHQQSSSYKFNCIDSLSFKAWDYVYTSQSFRVNINHGDTPTFGVTVIDSYILEISTTRYLLPMIPMHDLNSKLEVLSIFRNHLEKIQSSEKRVYPISIGENELSFDTKFQASSYLPEFYYNFEVIMDGIKNQKQVKYSVLFRLTVSRFNVKMEINHDDDFFVGCKEVSGFNSVYYNNELRRIFNLSKYRAVWEDKPVYSAIIKK
eukprot:GAHX01001553.1.p1 GENE.GAHX01001553.1~~GAHX01001553.1.p1  ORF type:complete len:216 (+),score=14.05 GAHX01001553.1:235-882(+)